MRLLSCPLECATDGTLYRLFGSSKLLPVSGDSIHDFIKKANEPGVSSYVTIICFMNNELLHV